MTALSEGFRQEMAGLVADYGYLDEPQQELLLLFVDAAATKLSGAGVPAQEAHPEYREAVVSLAAYRYLKRTALATSSGANDRDLGYEQMVRDYVHRLRDPEVVDRAP